MTGGITNTTYVMTAIILGIHLDTLFRKSGDTDVPNKAPNTK